MWVVNQGCNKNLFICLGCFEGWVGPAVGDFTGSSTTGSKNDEKKYPEY